MDTNKTRVFGNIYQFPQKKSAAAAAHRDHRSPGEALPRQYGEVEYAEIEFGNGWYHAAAIQETAHSPALPPARTRN